MPFAVFCRFDPDNPFPLMFRYLYLLDPLKTKGLKTNIGFPTESSKIMGYCNCKTSGFHTNLGFSKPVANPSTEISPLPRLNSFSSESGVLHHQAVWDTQPLDGCGMVLLQ